MTTEQSYYERKWMLAGFALSYAKLRPLATPEQKPVIDGWLRALADLVITHSDSHRGARNNHFYWEGLAVTATGAVTEDPQMLAWGSGVFNSAMSQIQPDGDLPEEMSRAAKAVHYQIFATEPLVMMASILDVHSVKLDALVRFTVDAARDPAAVEKRTGFAQEPVKDADLSWLAIYLRHEPGQRSAYAAPPKAGSVSTLGGDLSEANPLEHGRP